VRLPIDEFEKYIGRPLKDPYGRDVGYIVSFYADVSGIVNEVEVEHSNGTFKSYPIYQFSFEKDGIIFIPTWKAEALEVMKQLEIVRKRMKALNELHDKGEIADHAYKEFRSKLEKEYERIKVKSREVREKLKIRIAMVEKEIMEIERALAAIKISRMAGEIGDSTFSRVYVMLKRSLDRYFTEKKDVEKTLDELNKLETEPVFIEKIERKEAKIPSPAPSEKKEQSAPLPKEEKPLVVKIVEGS